MNKICGYNCEHNKGGQCQITYCDKIGEITTTTQWLSGGRQQGKTYQLIKNQQKEIERLNNIIKSIKEELKVYIEITIDHLETNNEEINFELRNKCRAMREIKEELLNIIEKELKEGK